MRLARSRVPRVSGLLAFAMFVSIARGDDGPAATTRDAAPAATAGATTTRDDVPASTTGDEGPAVTPPKAPCPAAAPVASSRDDAPEPVRHFGLGWIAGNGLGFLTGDVIVAAAPRVALDVQVGIDLGRFTQFDYAVAPALRVHLRANRSGPYVAAGGGLVRMRYEIPSEPEPLRWYRTMLFSNVGYEWRDASGLGIFVGLGVGFHPEVRIPGSAWINRGYRGVNLEFGFRYLLF